MSILSILNELSATPSSLEKISILKREKNNHILSQVIFLALDPYTNFWIKQIPEYTQEKTVALEVGLRELEKISSRRYTGHAARDHLQNILSSLSTDDAEVIERIISRDLKCGVSDATVNKVWDNLIQTFDFMLCYKDTSGITYPAYCQPKLDGGRVHCKLVNGKAVMMSRNGSILELHGVFDDELNMLLKEGEVIDGELVFYNNGVALDRKTSNGHYNKCVKNTVDKMTVSMAKMTVWDIVDYTSVIPYKDRLQELQKRFDRKQFEKFLLIKNYIVNSEEEAQELFIKYRNLGEEGTILKNINSKWKGSRSKDLGKQKAVEECDLEVIDWIEGTGKYSGMLGAVVAKTRDGKLVTNVGSGFSDEERRMRPEDIVGKIITVVYNEVITSKNKDTASLFLPRFSVIRLDKNVANTFEELK